MHLSLAPLLWDGDWGKTVNSNMAFPFLAQWWQVHRGGTEFSNFNQDLSGLILLLRCCRVKIIPFQLLLYPSFLSWVCLFLFVITGVLKATHTCCTVQQGKSMLLGYCLAGRIAPWDQPGAGVASSQGNLIPCQWGKTWLSWSRIFRAVPANWVLSKLQTDLLTVLWKVVPSISVLYTDLKKPFCKEE